MDLITLALARKYVQETANSLGAVKGAPATIESITPIDGGNNVVFAWTGADGTKLTHTLFIADGKEQKIKTINGEPMTGDGDIRQAIISLLVELGVYSGTSGDDVVPDDDVASDNEVGDMIEDVFGNGSGTTTPPDGGETGDDTPITDGSLATDDEVNDVLNDIFGN